jgi:hypothetical protein
MQSIDLGFGSNSMECGQQRRDSIHSAAVSNHSVLLAALQEADGRYISHCAGACYSALIKEPLKDVNLNAERLTCS